MYTRLYRCVQLAYKSDSRSRDRAHCYLARNWRRSIVARFTLFIRVVLINLRLRWTSVPNYECTYFGLKMFHSSEHTSPVIVTLYRRMTIRLIAQSLKAQSRYRTKGKGTSKGSYIVVKHASRNVYPWRIWLVAGCPREDSFQIRRFPSERWFTVATACFWPGNVFSRDYRELRFRRMVCDCLLLFPSEL